MRRIDVREAVKLSRHGYLSHGDDGVVRGMFFDDEHGTVLEPVEVVVPMPGDVVQVIGDDAYYATHDGQRGVIDEPHYGPEFVMCVFGASAFRTVSDNEAGYYVSVSGGPCPAIRPENLEYLGTTEQRFWQWGPRGRGAGGGVDYTMTVNLWGWRGVER